MATFYVDVNADVGGTGTTNGLTGATCAFKSLSICHAARLATLAGSLAGAGVETWICGSNHATLHTADTTSVSVSGWTGATANDYIRITTDATSKAGMVWSTSKYRLSLSANATVLAPSTDYTRVEGLQIESNDVGTAANILYTPAAVGALRLLANHIRWSVAGTAIALGRELATVATSGANIVANNLVYGGSGATAHGIYLRAPDATTKSLVYANTVYGCAAYGIRNRDGFGYAQNNLVINCATSVGGLSYYEQSAYLRADYNGFDSGPDPGQNGADLRARLDAEIFVDAVGLDYSLRVGSAAAGHGIPLTKDPYGFYDVGSIDLTGAARGASTWALGCHEVAPAATLGNGRPNALRPAIFAPGRAR